MRIVEGCFSIRIPKSAFRNSSMNTLTVIMFLIAAVLLTIAYIQGDGRHIEGLKAGAKSFLQYLPLLFAAFIIAGFIEIVIPREWITQRLGRGAGFKGILIASLLGFLTPAGPYVSFPIVASIYRAGAGLGSMVAYITAWGLLGVGKLPYEIAIMGPRFALMRYTCTLAFPLLAGLLANYLFARFQ